MKKHQSSPLVCMLHAGKVWKVFGQLYGTFQYIYTNTYVKIIIGVFFLPLGGAAEHIVEEKIKLGRPITF